MQHTGMLVTEWPIVLGCEASGVVLAVGADVKRFRPGDHVFGCSRLGVSAYATFQETFLMDEDLTFKRVTGVTTESACTIGVALEVSWCPASSP